MKKCISCEGLIQDYCEECPFCGKKVFKKWEVVRGCEKETYSEHDKATDDSIVIDYSYNNLKDVVSNGQ